MDCLFFWPLYGLIDRTASEMTGNRMRELRLYGGMTACCEKMEVDLYIYIYIYIYSVLCCGAIFCHLQVNDCRSLSKSITSKGGKKNANVLHEFPYDHIRKHLSVPTLRLCSINSKNSLIMNEKCCSFSFTPTLSTSYSDTSNRTASITLTKTSLEL